MIISDSAPLSTAVTRRDSEFFASGMSCQSSSCVTCAGLSGKTTSTRRFC